MARQQGGEQPPDMPHERGQPPGVLDETEVDVPPPRVSTGRPPEQEQDRPASTDPEPWAALDREEPTPVVAHTPDLAPGTAADDEPTQPLAAEPELATFPEATGEPALDLEASGESSNEPAASLLARPEIAVYIAAEQGWRSGRPRRSLVARAWYALPSPIRIALALLFLPLTGYVLTFRSEWKAGVKTVVVAVWTALLLAPVLAQVPGGPVRVPVPPDDVPVSAAPNEVAAMARPGVPAVTVAPTGSRVTGPSATPVSSPTPGLMSAPGSAPTPAPGGAPTPRPTSVPASPVGLPPSPGSTPTSPADTCGAPENPWGYNFCGGHLVNSPPQSFCSVFNCVSHFWDEKSASYVAECNDGTYAQDTRGPGSCNAHAGAMRPLYGP
jgi:hypothetical protein